jgi:hypothetical protein
MEEDDRVDCNTESSLNGHLESSMQQDVMFQMRLGVCVLVCVLYVIMIQVHRYLSPRSTSDACCMKEYVCKEYVKYVKSMYIHTLYVKSM